MDSIELTISKFRDYQPRNDLKSLNWFRLESSIFDDDGLHDKLATDGMILFIYLLSRAAKKNNETILVSINSIEKRLCIKKQRAFELIKILEQNQIVHGLVTDSLRSRSATLHNTTLHNEHNKTIMPEIKISDLDFDSAYFLYPLKKGKQKGLIKLKKEITTVEDLELFKKAIEQYSADLKKNKTESKYIKHFSTFANEWRDWLEPDAGKSKINNSNNSFENQREDSNAEFKRINDELWAEYDRNQK